MRLIVRFLCAFAPLRESFVIDGEIAQRREGAKTKTAAAW
jgi:hypothetical protein